MKFILLLFQLNNIHKHIQLIQIIINTTYLFNKQETKYALQKLTVNNFLKTITINNITTYRIENKNKITEKVDQLIKTDATIRNIMNITKEMYISTALYYKVSD